MKHNIIKYFLLLTCLFFIQAKVFSQADEWIVPDNKKDVVSPFKFTDETRKAGGDIFDKNCKSCHGEPTKGNYAKLQPPPGDPASESYQNQTDGEMFYRITEGHGLMPQFKNILTEKERWQVISYIRSFNKKYVQPALAKVEEFKGDKVRFELNYDDNDSSKKILAKAIGTINEKEEPLKNTNLVLFVKRYFGSLQIGESTQTNNEGIASFEFPEDLPGNDSGYVELTVKLENASQFGEAQKTEFVHTGNPKNLEKLTDQRAMWNVITKAPIWLIFSYFGVVLFVWGTIIYIVFQVLKIRKIGSDTLLND